MSTTISGDASSLPLPTASCVEIKSTSSSKKGILVPKFWI